MPANDQQLRKITILEKCVQKDETLERKPSPETETNFTIENWYCPGTNETVLNMFKKEK